MKNLSCALIVSFAFCFTDSVKAQFGMDWQKCLGGSSDDRAEDIQVTTDGGFIIAGTTNSNDGDVSGNQGGFDFWVVKLDLDGNLEWQKCLGGASGDQAYSIEQTIDGGFIVAGSTHSNDGDVSGNHGNSDYWIVKLDSMGNIEWQKCLGGTSSEWPYCVHQISDGGYIISGYTFSTDGDVSGNHGSFDYWIVKLDSLGNLEWQKCLGGSDYDKAYSIQQTTDAGFIVAGTSLSFDGDVTGNHGGQFSGDCWIVKLDISGNIEWQKALGGHLDEVPESILQTPDNGFIIAAGSTWADGDVSCNYYNTHYDFWIVKVDSVGNIEWDQCYGWELDDRAMEVRLTADGGYLVAGNYIGPWNALSDYLTLKLDSDGNVINWIKVGGSAHDYVFSLNHTANDGFIEAGVTYSNDFDIDSANHGGSDAWIVKLCNNTTVYYADEDSDGFGNNLSMEAFCNAPDGYVVNNSDCNDSSSVIHPGAIEIANGIDDDCDGIIDEPCSSGFYLIADTIIPHHYWAINLAMGTGPLTYLWSWNDGTYDSIDYPSHIYANEGFYTICLTIQDSTGCVDSTCIYYDIQKMSSAESENTIVKVDVVDTIPSIPTIIQNTNVLQSWSVFPNPASGNSFIHYTLSTPATVSIALYDVLGNKLQQVVNGNQEQGEHNATIDARKLSNGVYVLQMRAGEQVEAQKIVVMH